MRVEGRHPTAASATSGGKPCAVISPVMDSLQASTLLVSCRSVAPSNVVHIPGSDAKQLGKGGAGGCVDVEAWLVVDAAVEIRSDAVDVPAEVDDVVVEATRHEFLLFRQATILEPRTVLAVSRHVLATT